MMTTGEADLTQAYDELRESVLRVLDSRLRGRRITFDPSDLEDFYNEAWHALYLKLREGEPIESPGGFLVQVSWFRAIDEFRRRHPEEHDDEADVTAVATGDDVDDRIDAGNVLRAFTEGIRGTLDEREASAAVLCYLHGMSRPEAAEVLGIPDGRMQKLMDGVSKKLGPVIEALRDGNWCETRDSLVKAYALGLLDPEGERYALAVSHLDACAGCRRRVLGLRGIASVTPPLALPWAALQYGAGGATLASASTAAGSSSAPPGGLGGPLRHVLRARRSGRALAGAAVAVVAVVAAAVALAAGGGKRDPVRTTSADPAVAAVTPAATTAAAATTTKAERAAAAARARKAARAKAQRRAVAQRRAAAARRARARREAAAAATPAPAATTVPTPEPTAAPTVTAPATTAPTAAPTTVPTAAPTQAPATDAAQEFDFEP